MLSGGSLTFGKLASTEKMCPPALMEQEARFLAGLERMAKVRFEQGLLILLDTNNEIVIKASRRPK